MARNEEANLNETGTESSQNIACPKCKGTGVIFTDDVNRTGVLCCDKCETGRLIWSRMQELLEDLDVPGPVSAHPETTDRIIRDLIPRLYSRPDSGSA
jgi:hypothetical protein